MYHSRLFCVVTREYVARNYVMKAISIDSIYMYIYIYIGNDSEYPLLAHISWGRISFRRTSLLELLYDSCDWSWQIGFLKQLWLETTKKSAWSSMPKICAFHFLPVPLHKPHGTPKMTHPLWHPLICHMTHLFHTTEMKVWEIDRQATKGRETPWDIYESTRLLHATAPRLPRFPSSMKPLVGFMMGLEGKRQIFRGLL